MKRILPLVLAGFLLLPLQAQDTLVLKNGDSRTGQITAETEEGITFKFGVPLANGQQGQMSRHLPWTAIDWIEFASLPGEAEILAHPETAGEDRLRELWLSRMRHLAQPRSTAPRLGLLYAARLLSQDSKHAWERALEVCSRVETLAWDEAARAQGTQGRLQTLIRLGRIDEAIGEARQMAEHAENPAVLIEAKQVLAAAEIDRLKRIEKEHPRWQLDDEIQPVWVAHFNQALDLYLHAYLFYGSHEAPAARGLLGAAETYHHAGDLRNARACAEDILRHYPDTPSRPAAEQLIQQLNATASP